MVENLSLYRYNDANFPVGETPGGRLAPSSGLEVLLSSGNLFHPLHGKAQRRRSER